MTDIIIIGAGTAGLTAAIYGARAGLSVKVIEKAFYGGQIISTSSIENYPGMPGINGADFAIALYNQAKALGAQILYETINSVNLSSDTKAITTSKGVHEAKAVIIATGAKPRMLGVSGEEKWVGRGIAFCATCDAPLYKGKAVAVVGGGNVAIGDALLLSDLCRKVTIIHRSENFEAERMQLEQVRAKENVQFITNSNVKEIVGADKIEGLIIENKIDFQITEIPIDGLFIAIGFEPDNLLFAPEVNLDEKGYIIAGEDCKTNLPGVFVAGDTRTKAVRQIVTAANDGSISALAASEYINNSVKYKEVASC
ncbi:MAG: thioredoxin-disulfide reductase [Oscillospiraceae bacterium]|nr:thioredoxin-disulfide reductase [Oscillospiraceae bacterium]